MKLHEMKKTAIVAMALMYCTMMSAGTRFTYTFDVNRPLDAALPTECTVKTTLTKSLLGLNAQQLSSAQLRATWIGSTGRESWYESSTTGVTGEKGHWFTKTGVATNKVKNHCIKVVWNNPIFLISHDITGGNVEVGNTYTVKEALVNKDEADTLVYVFNVTIGEPGTAESVTTDQPDVVGRKSQTDGWLVQPLVRQNEQDPQRHNWISVNVGDKITLSCDIIDKETYVSGKYGWLKYYWDKKNKKDATKNVRSYKVDDFVLTESATLEDAGMYRLTARLTDKNGKMVIKSYYYYVDVQEHAGEFKEWQTYSLTYDFHSEYPTLKTPAKVHNIKKKNGQPANQYAGEWWSVFWGDDLNSEVGTDKATVMGAAKRLVEKYDYDFAYIRDYMGWPPDLSAREGYKSFVYIFGSGLANDNESKTTKGGYQSSTYVDGKNYACVWASYYPFSRFREDAAQKGWTDIDYQCDAMVHEGIHATFADLGACRGSSWFHEGGNTWLQGQVYARRDGFHGDAGFLDGGPFLAPHMPIECYSGWLQDGSYGGPAAEGVNMYASNGSQVCTWRNYLGGVQYANAFPTVVANVCGDGSIPWIWRYCKNRVLETMADTLGDEKMRDVIVQYRARQALFDLGGWDNSYRAVTNSYFGSTVRAEYSNGVCAGSGQPITGHNSNSDQMACWINVAPYRLTPYQTVELNDSHGWMAPDTLTNPGWSGANIIPIHVKGDVANVEFRPEDTNMRALLCYRTADGQCYYSQTVLCGNMSIDITPKPANGVIFCVVVNTDYIYTGSEQRKHHWDYRLRFGEGAIAVADPYIKWFYYEQKLTDKAYEDGLTGIEEVVADEALASDDIKIMSSTFHPGGTVEVDLGSLRSSDISLRVIGASGVVTAEGRLRTDGSFTLPAHLQSGLYVLVFTYRQQQKVFKVIVR